MEHTAYSDLSRRVTELEAEVARLRNSMINNEPLVARHLEEWQKLNLDDLGELAVVLFWYWVYRMQG